MYDTLPDDRHSNQESMTDRIAVVCNQFKEALGEETRPRIEDYLGDATEPVRRALLKELLTLELAYRRRNGETPQVADYSARFPLDTVILSGCFADPSDPETAPPFAARVADTLSMPPPSGDADATFVPGTDLDSTHPVNKSFGDYELLEEIARGGMGVVFKARHVKLKRTVALKMILAGQLASTDDVQRFYTEAEAAAKLDHPGIVPIYEVGQHDGQHYFSMAYVEGQSLADRVIDGPLPPGEAAKLVKAIAEAMGYAHEHGVIHRDLKPGNVLLDTTAQPRITDFGLAKQTECDLQLTGTGQILGTPSYMPPEQAAGELDEVGPLSDVYSMGAILYCLLTGRPPFQADNVMDTLLQVAGKEPVPPGQLNPKVPRDLETITLKCLEKPPHRRYSDASALADELRRFLKGEPIQARPINRPAKAWRWCKRHPAVAIWMTAAIVLLIAGSAVSTWFGFQATRNEAKALELASEKDELAAKSLKLAGEKDELAKQERQAREASERQTKATAWHLYVARLFPMVDAWKKRDFGRLEHLLGEAVPEEGEIDFRGWEWYYFLDQCRQASVKIPSSENVTPRPDWCQKTGKIAVSVGDDIEIWNADGQKPEETFTVPGYVSTVSWDPEGKRIAFTSEQGRVRILTVSNGEVSPPLDGHTEVVLQLAWSHDGKRLASAERVNGLVNIWDTEKLRLLCSMPSEYKQRRSLKCLDWHPDGNRLAMGSAHETCSVWDTSTGREIWRKTTGGGGDSVGGIAWSPDGKRLAASHCSNKGVIVWDEQGVELHSMPANLVYSLRWCPDGTQLAFGGVDHSLTIWRPGTSEIQTLRIHDSPVITVRWSPDGKRVLSASVFGGVRICSAWKDVSTATEPPIAEGVSDVAWRPNSEQLACAPQGSIVDVGGKLLRVVPLGPKDKSIAWSPDGDRLVSAGRSGATLWNADSGQPIRQFDVPLSDYTQNSFAMWSANGTRVTITCTNLETLVWNAPSFQKSGMFKTPRLWSAALSPDGRKLAVGLGDGISLQVWDTHTLQCVLTLKGERFLSVAYSPDGHLIAAGNDYGGVSFVRAADGEINRTLQAHKGYVRGLQFCPNGHRLATGSEDGTVKIWDAATGQNLLTLDCGDEVHAVAWSSDNHNLAVACADGVRIFRADAAMPSTGYGDDVLLAQRDTGLTVSGPRDVLENAINESKSAGELAVGRFLLRLGHDIRVDDEWITKEDDLDDVQGSISGVRLTSAANVTPAVVEQLADLENLNALELNATAVDLSTLTPLDEPLSIRELTLSHALLSANAVDHLRRLPQLKKVILQDSSFTPDGIAAAATLEPLYEVSLRGLHVTDPIAQQLGGLPRLKRIELVGTRVSEAAVKSLRDELPDTQIVYENYAADRHASEWVLKVGGKVTIVDDGETKAVAQVSDFPSYPFRVTEIDLEGCQGIANDDVARLAKLTALKKLDLCGENIDDDALRHLSGLTKLQSLRIRSTTVTGRGFQHLAGLKNLHGLSCFVPITDEGLAYLPQFKSLRGLTLQYGSSFTDEGLRPLAELRELQSVAIFSGKRTATGLRYLAELPNLRVLNLFNNRLTDADLEPLGRIASLERLMLSGNPRLGDAGLEHLHSLSNLKLLQAQRNYITRNGVELLRLKIPGCEVEYETIPRPEVELAKLIEDIKAAPNNAGLWHKRAMFHERHQQWKEARASREEASKLAPDSRHQRTMAALLCLMLGDETAYRAHCRHNFDLLKSGTFTPNDKSMFSNVCALLPWAEAEHQLLLKAAEEGAKDDPTKWYRFHPPISVLYRVQRYNEALEAIDACKDLTAGFAPLIAADLLWGAMCHHQLGQRDEAKQLLAEAVKLIDRQLPGPGEIIGYSPVIHIECHIIRREAEKLIGSPSAEPERP